MKKRICMLSCSVIVLVLLCFLSIEKDVIIVYGADKEETITGKTYELEEDDGYELSKAKEVNETTERFFLKGDIAYVSTNNGFVSYAVNSGNLKLFVNDQFARDLYQSANTKDWYITSDSTDEVDGIELSNDVDTGAIIVQTSKNGKAWVTVDTETDMYVKMSSINSREVNGASIDAFYETSNVQMTNGCYFRIIVAYALERETDPTDLWITSIKNYEEKERMEIYEFYAFDVSVNQTEKLDTQKAYEFGEVYRVDSPNGFKDPELIKSDDPHIDWSVGKFYVSGYTAVKMDGDIPIFLKVPGDKAALWFNLEQELDKCNGRTDVKVNYIDTGSDIYFGTPTIANFGRGALIIRKTDYQNQKERQIYTNYLEASATVGANTRVDLFEEGDYEVALDYQLHYDKPFVFGTTTKTLTYRIFFKFKVRNGDISAFLRDVETNQFITNANVAEQGFYIDVANSHYLDMTIKREVLSEGLDGIVEDTKFSGVAKEGRNYTEEGIYTVTVKNLVTGDSVQKKVYVGHRDIIIAHMKTGIPISTINERLEAGAYIDEAGNIIDPESDIEDELEEEFEDEPENSEDIQIEEQEEELVVTPMPKIEKKENEAVSANVTKDNIEQTSKGPNVFVIFAIVVVVCIAGAIAYKKRFAQNKAKGMKIEETDKKEDADKKEESGKKEENTEKKDDPKTQKNVSEIKEENAGKKGDSETKKETAEKKEDSEKIGEDAE